MSAVELQLDIDEFEALLAASERPNVKAVLEKEKARLEAEIKALESKAERASAEGVSDVSSLLLYFSCSLSHASETALTLPRRHAYPFAADAPPLRPPALFSWSCARCGRVEEGGGTEVHGQKWLHRREQ